MSNYNDNESVKYNLFVTILISDHKNLKKYISVWLSKLSNFV